jgi:hypothetical protein
MHIYASLSQTLSFSHPLRPSSLTLFVSLILSFGPSHRRPPPSAAAILPRSQPLTLSSNLNLTSSGISLGLGIVVDCRLPAEVTGFSLGWLLFSFLAYHLSLSPNWQWRLIMEMPSVGKSRWIYPLSNVGQGGRQKWYSQPRVIRHPPLLLKAFSSHCFPTFICREMLYVLKLLQSEPY